MAFVAYHLAHGSRMRLTLGISTVLRPPGADLLALHRPAAGCDGLLEGGVSRTTGNVCALVRAGGERLASDRPAKRVAGLRDIQGTGLDRR